MKVKELIKELKQKIALPQNQKFLKKLHFFKINSDDYIIPLTKNFGIKLKTIKSIEKDREYYKRINPNSLNERGRKKRDFIVKEKYKDFTINIDGKNYVLWGYGKINYQKGKLIGFMDIYIQNEKEIFLL